MPVESCSRQAEWGPHSLCAIFMFAVSIDIRLIRHSTKVFALGIPGSFKKRHALDAAEMCLKVARLAEEAWGMTKTT